MQLRDIMQGSPITASKSDTVAAAARRMRDANVGCLIITNSSQPAGIVTDRDLVIRCAGGGHAPESCTVEHHMTAPLITARPDMDLLEAVHLMTEKQVKRLPIVEGERLTGIVSFADVANALDRPMHDLLMGMGRVRR
jgi:CBS domain-containing protein